MRKDNDFRIVIKNFNRGFAPLWAFNSLTEEGTNGQASAMANVEVLSPDFITQGPGLSDLTNGNQASVVYEAINFILDRPAADNSAYAVGATKLFQFSSTTVTSNATWPRIITGATDGESCIEFQGNLYYFYNKSSGADFGSYDLGSTFDDDWGSTRPTGAAAIYSALHPLAKKEDILLFGNGRYVGSLIYATLTLNSIKLDFGANTEVADIGFNGNQWVIAVNEGISGTNRNSASIFLWEASATNATLDDEIAIGPYKIGFIYPIGGVIYVAYQDLTTTAGFRIGYISGRELKEIGSFTGSLPNFAQKTLYKHTILFVSSGSIYSAGAMSDKLPFQLSQIVDGGYATVGAIASPFGTPIVASTDGGSNQRLAQFSGLDTACSWRSIVYSLINDQGFRGMVDNIIVVTSVLGAEARCDLQLEYDQDTDDSGTVKQITGTSKRVYPFTGFGKAHEDFRVFLNWANGSTTNACQIRKIIILGHFTEI